MMEELSGDLFEPGGGRSRESLWWTVTHEGERSSRCSLRVRGDIRNAGLCAMKLSVTPWPPLAVQGLCSNVAVSREGRIMACIRNRENGSEGESWSPGAPALRWCWRREMRVVLWFGALLPLRAPEVGGCGGGGGIGCAGAQAAFAAFQGTEYAALGDVALPLEADCLGGVSARGADKDKELRVRWRPWRRVCERCARAASCASSLGSANGWGSAHDATGRMARSRCGLRVPRTALAALVIALPLQCTRLQEGAVLAELNLAGRRRQFSVLLTVEQLVTVKLLLGGRWVCGPKQPALVFDLVLTPGSILDVTTTDQAGTVDGTALLVVETKYSPSPSRRARCTLRGGASCPPRAVVWRFPGRQLACVGHGPLVHYSAFAVPGLVSVAVGTSRGCLRAASTREHRRAVGHHPKIEPYGGAPIWGLVA